MKDRKSAGSRSPAPNDDAGGKTPQLSPKFRERSANNSARFTTIWSHKAFPTVSPIC